MKVQTTAAVSDPPSAVSVRRATLDDVAAMDQLMRQTDTAPAGVDTSALSAATALRVANCDVLVGERGTQRAYLLAIRQRNFTDIHGMTKAPAWDFLRAFIRHLFARPDVRVLRAAVPARRRDLRWLLCWAGFRRSGNWFFLSRDHLNLNTI